MFGRLGLLRINPSPKYLFVHVPKAAGESLLRWLSGNILTVKFRSPSAPRRFPTGEYLLYTGHLDTDWLVDQKFFRPKQLQGAWSFGFVRNPFRRVASLYRHNLRERAVPEMDFSEYLTFLEGLTPGAYPGRGGPSRFRASPMSTWLRPTRWHGPREIFRFEELDDAIMRIREKTGIRSNPPRINTSDQDQEPIQISESDVDAVRRLYFSDFQLYGYSLDPPAESV